FTLADLGRDKEAITQILSLTRESDDPEFEPRRLLYLAGCYVRTGKDNLARARLDELLSMSPTRRYRAEAHLHLASLDAQTGSYARAKHHFELFENDRQFTTIADKTVKQINSAINEGLTSK